MFLLPSVLKVKHSFAELLLGWFDALVGWLVVGKGAKNKLTMLVLALHIRHVCVYVCVNVSFAFTHTSYVNPCKIYIVSLSLCFFFAPCPYFVWLVGASQCLQSLNNSVSSASQHLRQRNFGGSSN